MLGGGPAYMPRRPCRLAILLHQGSDSTALHAEVRTSQVTAAARQAGRQGQPSMTPQHSSRAGEERTETAAHLGH